MLEHSLFFQNTFLLANISINNILEILVLFYSNSNIVFAD